MLRMEIALFLVVAFVAYMYFSAEKEQTALHGTFSVLMVAVLVHLALDGATVYTVNHLNTVPELLNGILHRLFLGSMVVVIFLFYQYIAILVQEETGKRRRLDWPARIFLIVAVLGNFLLPISYTMTEEGNYSSGPYMLVPYAAVAFYLLLCAGLLAANWRKIDQKKKSAIGIALVIEFVVCLLQGLHHTWLISGMGIALMTLSFYLTLENPEALRAELVEQKMSMLYLKSQVNPHFLYNTLDSIAWMCEQGRNADAVKMVHALARLFRISISRGHELIPIAKEIEHAESYLQIQMYRYKNQFTYAFDVDPDCLGYYCNKITLQPIIENAITHGLDLMVEEGRIDVRVRSDGEDIVFSVQDNGVGMSEEQIEATMRQEPTDRTGIGIRNVNDRLKIYFGRGYGLHITSEPDVGTCVEIRMPKIREGDYEKK